MYAYEHDFSKEDVQTWLDRQRKRYKEYAFENLQTDQLYAIIKADNISSIKVAESLGMKKVDEFMTGYYNGETLHYLYAIERTK